MGVDLTNVLDFGANSVPCFARFQAETRSSQETTATLKDYAAGRVQHVPEQHRDDADGQRELGVRLVWARGPRSVIRRSSPGGRRSVTRRRRPEASRSSSAGRRRQRLRARPGAHGGLRSERVRLGKFSDSPLLGRGADGARVGLLPRGVQRRLELSGLEGSGHERVLPGRRRKHPDLAWVGDEPDGHEPRADDHGERGRRDARRGPAHGHGVDRQRPRLVRRLADVHLHGWRTTASCQVTITSGAGTTIVSATSAIPVNGVMLTRTTKTAANTAAGGWATRRRAG